MPKVLVVGHTRAGTGLARVVDLIAQALQPACEVQVLSIEWQTPPQLTFAGVQHSNPDNWDPVAGAELARLAARWHPDVVLVNNDFAKLPYYVRSLAGLTPRPRLVYYCTVPGPLLHSNWAHLLPEVTALVVPTRFACAQVEAACQAIGRPDLTSCLHLVPHCVENEAFYPVDGAEARAQVLPPRWHGPEAFMVLNANVFQARKELPLTLAGFARFAHNKPPDVGLWLHTNRWLGRTDLLALAHQQGIAERVHLTPERMTETQFNLLYNACEVGLNTAHAEGWGLLAFEHAAARKAQVMPALGPLAELWEDQAELLPISEKRRGYGWFAQEVTTAEAVAQALNRLYDDQAYRSRLGTRAHENYLTTAYSIASVSARWRALLEQIINTA